ncbi:MAG TPA: anaerobic ribonucleoside-triphosphate reductase activating protein [Candidatus Blautia faecavium]|uniref:Anaerobic ribonucleoside-triphosphate reductase activating protein n=1 Tax=Candidatus Blautia faecavium TaxID=2838487 RepID=A0A9D2LSS9_9FIRM|nr:anaerobic ribonucleoside-triphosphate reductase activating protein [Candidatus Blautia faecavium]
MRICGLNKTTLLDYPGKVAASIFTGGCNFRCPFCQNSSLVLSPDQEPELSQEEILNFLKKRQGILDGVCITGGEPTLHKELFDFLKKIKELQYSIKLDTNGSNPAVVKELVKEGLIDKVAMDIKACPENYPNLCGLSQVNLKSIENTVEFLMTGEIDYEFRTTAVKELHTKQDFIEIGQWLKGAKAYFLQAYRDSEEVLQPGYSSFSLEELKEFRGILLETIPLVEIRGID